MQKELVGLTVLLMLFAGSSNAQGLQDYDGAQLFERFCASCHGVTGKGDGPVASAVPALVPDVTRLSERQGGKFPEDDVRRIIDGRAVVVYHGTRYMPVWGYEFWVEEGADVEAQDRANRIINKLVGYIRAIQR